MTKLISALLMLVSVAVVADVPSDAGALHRRSDSHFRRPNQTGALYTAASNLIDAIQKLDDQAFDKADELSERGQQNAVAQLDQVADAASILERALRRQVIRELFDHDGHDRFGRTLKRLEQNEYAALQRAIDNLNRAGFGVQFAIQEVEQAWRAFERAIQDDYDHHHGQGGGNINGSCNGKFGGNFFNKVSHVECTVNGWGLYSYTVQFSNPQTGQQDSVTGTLNAQARVQNFTSSKVSVGRGAQFAVYVYRRGGQPVLISSGTCQGNPF